VYLGNIYRFKTCPRPRAVILNFPNYHSAAFLYGSAPIAHNVDKRLSYGGSAGFEPTLPSDITSRLLAMSLPPLWQPLFVGCFDFALNIFNVATFDSFIYKIVITK
jgi:hypothetical protein